MCSIWRSPIFLCWRSGGWPKHPLECVRPVLSQCEDDVHAHANLLSTFSGTAAENLTHEFHQLQTARNIIINTNNAFVEAHAAMIREGARIGMLGPNMSMTGEFDSNNPDHRIAIIRSHEAEMLLKQMLDHMLDFGRTAILFIRKYNKYKQSHKRKRLRGTYVVLADDARVRSAFYLS